MSSREIVEAAVRRAGLQAPVHFHEVVPSTNSVALALAEEGAPEWTLVAAGHQTAGRGRLGRTWVSEPGGSLLFSIVLRPELESDRALLVTLLAGASMAEAARYEAGQSIGCKWPNDLLTERGKVGGILAEASVAGGSVRHVVVGVGVNLGEPPPGVEGAAGLGGADPGRLLEGFLGRFREGYRPSGAVFSEGVLARYRPLCATLGRRARARTLDGTDVEGQAVDLDRSGNLVVETPEGARMTVGFGEVLHLR